MFRILTVVVLLSSALGSNLANASEQASNVNLSTKSLVRMTLWYQGLQTSAELAENQEVSSPEVSEELERALLDL